MLAYTESWNILYGVLIILHFPPSHSESPLSFSGLPHAPEDLFLLTVLPGNLFFHISSFY